MMVGVTDQPTDVADGDHDVTDRQPNDIADESIVDDGHLDPSGAAAPPPRPGWRQRIDTSVVIVCAIVAAGFVLVLNGVLSGVTGDERANLPPLVESVTPVPEAVQVLSQSNVFVDLAAGHTGRLVIDGEPIETVNVDEIGSIRVTPGVQVDLPPVTIYEPGNATLTFTPNENAPIQEFLEGEHKVQVVYWAIDEGPQRARTFTWTFTVV